MIERGSAGMNQKSIIALAVLASTAVGLLISAKAQPAPEREYGSLGRHQLALVLGVPEPYRSMSNPLPFSAQTLRQGASVYARHCASCHGDTGEGNGSAGEDLSLSPGNLAWLSRMPMAQWDGFLYWTVAEGVAPGAILDQDYAANSCWIFGRLSCSAFLHTGNESDTQQNETQQRNFGEH